MSDKRRGLGRGLGALIPSSASANASGNGAAPSRPVDLFFPEARKKTSDAEALLDVNDAAQAEAPESAPVKAGDSSDLTVDTAESDAATAEADVAAGAAVHGFQEDSGPEDGCAEVVACCCQAGRGRRRRAIGV